MRFRLVLARCGMTQAAVARRSRVPRQTVNHIAQHGGCSLMTFIKMRDAVARCGGVLAPEDCVPAAELEDHIAYHLRRAGVDPDA